MFIWCKFWWNVSYRKLISLVTCLVNLTCYWCAPCFLFSGQFITATRKVTTQKLTTGFFSLLYSLTHPYRFSYNPVGSELYLLPNFMAQKSCFAKCNHNLASSSPTHANDRIGPEMKLFGMKLVKASGFQIKFKLTWHFFVSFLISKLSFFDCQIDRHANETNNNNYRKVFFLSVCKRLNRSETNEVIG